MKSQITAAIIGCALMCAETDAKIITNKNIKKVEKVAVKVVTNPAVQQIVITAVSGNPAVSAVVVIAQALTNQLKASKSKLGKKKSIWHEIEGQVVDIVTKEVEGPIKDMVEDKVKEKAIEVVTDHLQDHLSQQDLEMLSDMIYVPIISDKLQDVIDWSTHAKIDIDSEDVQHYLHTIAQ